MLIKTIGVDKQHNNNTILNHQNQGTLEYPNLMENIFLTIGITTMLLYLIVEHCIKAKHFFLEFTTTEEKYRQIIQCHFRLNRQFFGMKP